ncbi:MAG: CobW family GTP-binding protein [Cyanobacteriota bacterium]
MTADSPLAPLRGLPVTVVGGYLGAGKTTLINGWLRETPRPDWAVLVNDLGALAIDADRLRTRHGRVLELTSGCLCCSLRDGLGEALLALARLPRPPHRLVIESSGMAIPERIAAQVSLHGLQRERLLLVVDLERIEQLWHDPWVGELVQRQFQGVDDVRLSKADRLEAATAAERQRWLRQALERLPAGSAPALDAASPWAQTHQWRQERPLSRERLLCWGAALGPDVLRLKGEVWLEDHPEGPVRVDGHGGQLELEADPADPWPSSLRRQGRLVVISRAGAAAPRWPTPEGP